MNNSYLDYKYALDVLSRFNRFVERDTSLAKKFEYHGYNFLQTYQQSMFGDILSWSQTKNTDNVQPKSTLIIGVKTLFLALVTILFSFLSVLWLVVSRRKNIIFSLDKTNGSYQNDFRTNYLYTAHKEKNLPYFEIIHTVLGRNMIKNLFARKRFALYLEGADFLVSPLVLMEKRKIANMHIYIDEKLFSAEEKELVHKLYTKYASSTVISKARVLFFRIILKISNVRNIYAIDDVRSINELVLASEVEGVSFTALQHGHFTKYHVGWLTMTKLRGKVPRPDTLLVWSEYWKQELLRLGTYFTPLQLVVSGEKSLCVPVDKIQDDKISVLLPYEKNAPKAEVLRYLETLLEYPDIDLYFKLRVDEDKQSQIEEYGLVPHLAKIILVRDIHEVLPRIDVVIGTYSTFLYDMVALEKPVLVLETSIDYGNGMIENNLADKLSKSTDNIYKTIKDTAEISHVELKKRREKLVGEQSILLKDSLTEMLVV